MSGVTTHEPAKAVPGSNCGLMAGQLIATHETRGLQHVGWSETIPPRDAREHWFVVRVLYDGMVQAYSSPLWARWSTVSLSPWRPSTQPSRTGAPCLPLVSLSMGPAAVIATSSSEVEHPTLS